MSAPYQLLPPLTTEEYAALKADIRARGVMVPVEVDEQGRTLDGHHRRQIAAELGIDCPTVTRAGMSEEAKREHVLKLNLLRRQLGTVAWAEAFRTLATERGVSWRPGRPFASENRATLSQIADELGVSRRTAQRRLRLAEKLADHPDLAEKVDRGELADIRAEREARNRWAVAQREAAREALKANPPAEPSSEGAEYWVGPPSVRCRLEHYLEERLPAVAELGKCYYHTQHRTDRCFSIRIPDDAPPDSLSDEARLVPGVADALTAVNSAVLEGRREVSEALDTLEAVVRRADKRLRAARKALEKAAEGAPTDEIPGGPDVPGSRRGWSSPPMPPHRTHCHEPLTISGWIKSGGWTGWGNEVMENSSPAPRRWSYARALSTQSGMVEGEA